MTLVLLRGLGVFLTLCGAPTLALAGGWVKQPADYYVKLGYGLPQTQEFRPSDSSGAEKRDMITESYSLYGELGVPAKWPLQVSLSAAYKSVTNKSVDVEDSFKNASFADTRLVTSHGIFSGNISESFPLGVATAGRLGVVLPTTPNEFRQGNESNRFDDVPASRTDLISSVDRGVASVIVGGGLSLSYSPVWFSLDLDVTAPYEMIFATQKLAASLGVGLPFNSWLQLTASRTGETAPFLDGDRAEEGTKTDSSAALSVGLTVYRGLALEAEAAYNQTSVEDIADWQSYSVGVSYRSL